MDIAQKEWLAIVPYLLSLRYPRFPPRPMHAFRRFCYDVTQSDTFEYIVLFLVVCNVLEMCIWWRGMDPTLLLIKERVNLFISVCFGVCNPQLLACDQCSKLSEPLQGSLVSEHGRN